jgi:hypothetical protein
MKVTGLSIQTPKLDNGMETNFTKGSTAPSMGPNMSDEPETDVRLLLSATSGLLYRSAPVNEIIPALAVVESDKRMMKAT